LSPLDWTLYHHAHRQLERQGRRLFVKLMLDAA
jgi:hypothetical protein